MKKIILSLISIILLLGQIVSAVAINEDEELINITGKNILTANHLPDAEFIITSEPDTFDNYFINANYYKKVELYTRELSFAKDKGELAEVIAHQIGKISNNMPTQARSQAKTNTIHLTDKKGKEIMSYSTKHIYSCEKLNKDKIDLTADRTAVDFLIQSGNNPHALISVYGRYLDYDKDSATEHIMNVYDYITYNFPEKLNQGYPTEAYEKAMNVANQVLKNRTESDKQKVKKDQIKISEKKLKQAKSSLKGLNPWNSSYTTLLLHSGKEY